MNKTLLTSYLILLSVFAFSQGVDNQTKSISIHGRIRESKVITIDYLKNLKSISIGDVTISNHKGDVKGVAKKLKGILLRDILETITLDTDNPKFVSEYYFTCVASDGYKVVFSWNEIFNTATGNSIFIVTEKDDKKMTDMTDSILLISTQDFKTGRRYVKNLEQILVSRIE